MRIRAAAVIASLCFAPPLAAQQVAEEMAEAAAALLATMVSPSRVEGIVGYQRRASLLLELEDEERLNWTYWPTERAGLALEHMTAEQRMLVHDLLSSALSARGHLKVVQIMQLEQILELLDDAGLPRSVGHYKLVFFGMPAADTPWGWRFEGHHVSLNVSIARGAVNVTPSFLGANPAEVRSGPLAGVRVLAAEEDLGRELVTSMDREQRTRAVLSEQAPNDILSGNLGRPPSDWDQWRVALQPAGIRVADLNEAQRHWVRRILEEVAGTYRPEISPQYLNDVALDELSFAWMGSIERRAPHYYRLQGPDFVFEFDNVQNGANHVHTVWRSKSGDFGADLLEEHYRSAHR